MQLRRLEVSNIRSFEAARLDLGPGTTLLVGDVGAGKSSLLYAVEMALFGVAEVDAAYLVRHGTSHAEVAVGLADAQHRYTVRRRFRKVKRRGRETYEPERLTFSQDGSPTPYSATEIRQRVIELLGFPDNPNPHAHSDLWRWAIYVPQERMRDILAADPEERLETVRKALGVERYRTAAENAQAVAADLRLSARHRREEAARMAHWDTEYADANRDADRLRVDRVALASAVTRETQEAGAAREARQRGEEAVARAHADRRELEGLQRDADADRRGLAATQDRRRSLLAEREQARAEEASLGPAAAGRDALLAARGAAEQAVRDRRLALDELSIRQRQLAAALAAMDASAARAAEATERQDKAARAQATAQAAAATLLEQGPVREPPAPTDLTLPDLERALTAATAAEHQTLDALARARAGLRQIEELLSGGVCPTCHQAVRPEQFGAHREEMARAGAGAEAAQGASASERRRLEDERKSRERFERAHERWVELESRRATAREALLDRERALAEARQAAAGTSRELEVARTTVDRLRPVEEEERHRRAEVVEGEARLKALADQEARAVAAEERLRALRTIDDRLSAEELRLREDEAAALQRQEGRRPRLEALSSALKQVTLEPAALDVLRVRESDAERRLADARGALVRADTRLDGLVERLAAAERGRADRAALSAEATDLDAKAAWIGEPFRTAVLRMEKELLAHAQTAFDRAFSRFFASLIDDPSLTARTDLAFTPEVTIAGEATPAEALSGGERTSLALAFRLALASVVRSLGAVRLETLLLDEPTDGFSSEQVVRMGELLEELALPQVVVVSHESQLTGIADRTVRVVKENGRSVLTDDRRAETTADPEGPAEVPPPTSPPPHVGRPRTP